MTVKVLPAPGFEPGSGLEPFHFSVLLCKFGDFTLYMISTHMSGNLTFTCPTRMADGLKIWRVKYWCESKICPRPHCWELADLPKIVGPTLPPGSAIPAAQYSSKAIILLYLIIKPCFCNHSHILKKLKPSYLGKPYNCTQNQWWHTRTTDARWGNCLHCTAENPLPLPNF